MENLYSQFLIANANTLMEDARCTRTEKEKLVPLANSLLRCCEKARKHGLLSLEEFIEGMDEDQACAIKMVIEGWDQELFMQTLILQLLARHPAGVKLLKGLMIIQGAVDIEQGINPVAVRLRLQALFGEDADLLEQPIEPDTENELPNWEHTLARVLSRCKPRGLSKDLNEALTALDDEHIGKLLRKTEGDKWVLALGFSGNRAVWEKLLSAMSNRTAQFILEAILALDSATDEEIIDSQTCILNALDAPVRKSEAKTGTKGENAIAQALSQDEIETLLEAINKVEGIESSRQALEDGSLSQKEIDSLLAGAPE
jgi:hypothetical protein